jgi:hypothetical protein
MKSWINIVLVIIIIVIALQFFMKEPFTPVESFTTVEPFTPGLKKIYRPYIRRARVHATKVYDNFTKKSHNLLTKLGII